MFEKNKYEVLQNKWDQLWFIRNYYLLMKAAKKFYKHDIPNTSKDIVTPFVELRPTIEASAHLIYENAQDLNALDFDRFVKYVVLHNGNLCDICAKFHNKKIFASQLLYLFAMNEMKNQVPMNSEAYAKEMGKEISFMLNDAPRQELTDIDYKQRDIVDVYHDIYMDTKVMPYVHKKVREQDVLKLALSYGMDKKIK